MSVCKSVCNLDDGAIGAIGSVNRPTPCLSASLSAMSSHHQDRVLGGGCARGACGQPLKDGSAYCLVHDEEHRRNDRDSKRRMRRVKRRASKPKCLDCPRPARPKLAYCLQCATRLCTRRASTKPAKVVAPSTVVADRTAVDRDGRSRFHGQGKRGAISRIDLTRKDLSWARDGITRALAGHEVVWAAMDIPRSDRDAAKSVAWGVAIHAARTVLAAALRDGQDISGVLDSIADEDA